MKGTTAYILSKNYTDASMDGAGSVRGVPAEIQSIVPITKSGRPGHRVTFSWTGTSGTVYTDTMDVMDGETPNITTEPITGGVRLTFTTVNPPQEVSVDIINSGGGGGGGSLLDELIASVTVGGVASGKRYPAGTLLEQIFRDMLNPTAYPTLTNPSATLTATGAKLLETGSTLNTTFTLTLNRGSINPQYTAASPYRSGEATDYTLDGTTQSSNTFSRTITSAKTSYQGSIAYAEGAQPKDSTGKNYSSPLPAGNVNSNVVSYEFVDALWANTANITTVAKLALVSKTAKIKQFDFPSQTVANPEEFHISASWTVTAVEVLNTLSNQWEDCSAEFTVSNVSHDDAAGNPVAYKKYICNLGYATGARKVRVKWA